MTAVDTNFLVRFLVGDDPKQSKTVYNILKEVEEQKSSLHVPVLVVLELIWVLDSAYKISREDIVGSLDQMILMPIFTFENLNSIQKSLQDSINTKYDLSDLLIANTAKEAGCESVLTFDKRASKHPLFTHLKGT
ncbi:MAG: type II toxin-antitoxin system VapC family toxin [Lentisphaerales bacterium]|nr:type II toxin-antitoxin system VapC family toxin [Lentisphaerales bacterium]